MFTRIDKSKYIYYFLILRAIDISDDNDHTLSETLHALFELRQTNYFEALSLRNDVLVVFKSK